MSYERKKYAVAACALLVFGTCLVLLRHSLWLIGLLGAWEAIGLMWYFRASRYEVWRKAAKRFGRPPLSLTRRIALTVVILIHCLGWPLWLAMGEDVFE